MTTPGGVPNLPQGALTLDTLATKLQDMSGDAMKSRAVERFPSIFNSSTGLNPALDITPFGILTRIWAEVNSLIANADPADIDGPEDLPELFLEFIEGLPVVGELVGLLEAILGTYDGDDETLLTIQEIFGPIRALVEVFADLDFSSPQAFLQSLIVAIGAVPEALGAFIDLLEDLIFGGDEASTLPLTLPFTLGGSPDVVTQFFYWIRKFTGIDDFDDLFSLNIVDLIVNFIETLLKPQELLAWLVDGILPDIQAPQIIHDVMDAIIRGFEGVPIVGPIVVPALQTVWDTIAALLGIGTDAQGTGTNNTAEIAAIKAGLAGNAVTGGVSFSDFFDRVASANPGADYTQFYGGSGGGTDGTDGTGTGHWFPSGGGIRSVVNRRNTPLTTNTQYAAMVLEDAPTLILVGNYGWRSLILRCNTAANTYIRFDVVYNDIWLYAVVSGTPTLLDTASGLNMKPGDFWELYAGDAADDYRFVVKQNGATRLDVVDSSHISQVGASYRYTGYGATAGNYLNIIVFSQYSPPDVAAFSAADRTG